MKKRRVLSLVVPAAFSVYILSNVNYFFGDKTNNPEKLPIAAPAATVSPEVKLHATNQIQQQYQQIMATEFGHGRDNLDAGNLTELVTQAREAQDEYDRELAIMALGETASPEAKSTIMASLNDSSNIVRTQAIRQIDRWPNDQERNAMLIEALNSHDIENLETVILAITRVDDRRLINKLKHLAKHADPDIRQAAKAALNLATTP